jgi:hypothetical protein
VAKFIHLNGPPGIGNTMLGGLLMLICLKVACGAAPGRKSIVTVTV